MVKLAMSWSREIHKLPLGTRYIGLLPKGCTLCHEGLKLVLFITGLCNRRCWYCPISDLRRGKDVIYANEVRINDIRDIIPHINLMEAKGTGITGGEPLLVFDRVIKVIELLKAEFGEEHHIHLYTNGELLSLNHACALKECGLDELRIHITSELSWKGIKNAINAGLNVGIEIPVIPNNGLNYYTNIIRRAESMGIRFINLNELELSESNYMALRIRGLTPRDDIPYAVKGSEELALSILEWASRNVHNINLHYCPARVKDAIQLKFRLKRVSCKVAKTHEVVDDDGLIVKGILESNINLQTLKGVLSRTIGERNVFVRNGKTIEFNVNYLDKVIDLLNSFPTILRNTRVYIIRVHPITHMIFEKIPVTVKR